MEQNIKASTFGSLKDHNLFFSKHVSISYDTLEKDNSAEYKILVQIEPLSVNNNIQDFCERSSDFDLVLTWHSDILKSNNSKLFPFGIYGNGYKPIENKITALKDYRFSLIIENEYSNNWFTEKLIDCLVTGTVPVFWGCPNIHKFFDPRGFILFNNIDQIPKIKSECNESAYKNLLPFIKKNYHSALEYVDIFDRITKTIKNEI